MKKFVNLLGIAALAAIIGFSMSACDLFGGDDEEGNSYVGTWNGSLTSDNQTAEDAKIVFTETTWTLTSEEAGISETGSYTVGGMGGATLKTSGNFTFGTASLGLGKKTLSFTASNSGPYAGCKGSFTKESVQSDSKFIGTWKGSVSKDGQKSDATIVFTDTTWTLTSTGASINETGTFTVGITSSSATLTRTGGGSFGTATILLGTLTITAASGSSFEGSTGTFTREGSSIGGSPFIGTWTGTITKDATSIEATLVFTEDTWTLTSTDSSINETGTYNGNNRLITLKSGGYNVGTATVLFNSLNLNITDGILEDASGSFNRFKE